MSSSSTSLFPALPKNPKLFGFLLDMIAIMNVINPVANITTVSCGISIPKCLQITSIINTNIKYTTILYMCIFHMSFFVILQLFILLFIIYVFEISI